MRQSDNETMKIGIDARLWDETGVGRYIRNLITELAKIDSKNTYYLFLKKKEIPAAGQLPPNFQKIECDIAWHSIAEQISLPPILSSYQLDLVHFPYFSVPVLYTGKFVVTIHDLTPYLYPTGRASTLPGPLYWTRQVGYRLGLKSATKRAAKIITVSNSVKKDLVRYFGVESSRVEVTYEGVFKKMSNVKAPALPAGRQMSNVKGPYFLYVGNAYPHKNLERLLEAFFRAKVDAKLVLVGKEDYFYKRLKEKIRKENVIFKHSISDAELSFLYKNAIALVFPSISEGFGLPALEAMANKCLVVCSDIPVFHEICKDAAIYFDPQNIHDMLDKLQRVVDLETAVGKRKKQQGLLRAGQFSWSKMAKETLQIYQSI